MKMAHELTTIEGDLVDFANKSCLYQGCSALIKLDGFTLPERYKTFADAIENFEVRDDDIWVCGFPKTGTTWTQEMVWCIANDLDFERAKVFLTERFPFLELSSLFDVTEAAKHNPDLDISEYTIDSVSLIENLPSPRFIKTHLPPNLLPRQLRTGEKKAKIVYVVRNVKDTCISYFHQCKLIRNFAGNLEDYCNLFIGNAVVYAPFWKHALGYWEKRMEENLLFIKYEDMKKDLSLVINKTATFLGKSLTMDQLSTLTEHLSFASMKANPAVNNENFLAYCQKLSNSKQKGKFMRNGNVDQWKTDMSPKDIEKFDNWTRENLKETHDDMYF